MFGQERKSGTAKFFKPHFILSLEFLIMSLGVAMIKATLDLLTPTSPTFSWKCLDKL